MFTNLGVHIHRFPTGRYGFVGSLPIALGDLVPATTADVLGCRTVASADGRTLAPRFPTFETEQEARLHATARAVALCN